MGVTNDQGVRDDTFFLLFPPVLRRGNPKKKRLPLFLSIKTVRLWYII